MTVPDLPESVRVVCFDAVGTLVQPAEPVPETYHRAGLRHGSRLGREQVAARFRNAFRTVFDTKRNEAETASPATSHDQQRRKWSEVVRTVFSDIENTGTLFAELWEWYGTPRAWQVFDDVRPVWQQLRGRGRQIALASNFDRRLYQLADGLDPLCESDWVFSSAGLGAEKPDPEFFRRIAERLDAEPRSLLMIGDSMERDVVAARRAGWLAKHSDGFFAREPVAAEDSNTV